MREPPRPTDEALRLQALCATNLVDTPIEERFERLTRLAQQMFSVPIAAISLVTEKRQWFKSIQGLDVQETSRDISFCGHAILNPEELLVVRDARLDSRFEDNPLVTADPKIRFYAGCPVKSSDGLTLGTICIIDRVPRDLASEDLWPLKDIAALVETELHRERASAVQDQLIASLSQEGRVELIDPVTRLWNRSGMERLFKHAQALRVHKQLPVGEMLIKFDGLDDIAGRYSDRARDEALRHVARRLLNCCRNQDVVGRWDGSTFMMLIEAGDRQSLEEIADRVLTRFREQKINTEVGEVGINATLGLAFHEAAPDDEGAPFCEAAANALARGVERGGNCIEQAW